MVELLWIFWPILVLVGYGVWRKRNISWRHDHGPSWSSTESDDLIFELMSGGLLIGFWLLLWGITAIATYSSAQSLSSFYYDTYPTYQRQVCRDGLILDNAALGDIREYNSNLREQRRWDAMPIIGFGVVGPDPELKPLSLTECPK